MRIAIISPASERIPPRQYGGTGRVIDALIKGLIEQGHEVVLYGTGDSLTSASLRYIVDAPTDTQNSLMDSDHVKYAFSSASDFDIIHDHTYFGAATQYSRYVNTPTVTTLHTVPQPQLVHLYKNFENYPLVSVSQSQQSLFTGANFIKTVYNGVDLKEFSLDERKGNYMLHIGAISWHKGSHIAAEIASHTDIPLVMAGRILDPNFFRVYISPHIQSGKVTYVGEVGGENRVKLFQQARLLLFPILWPEPFGLVMIEAMACGTPVVAFNRGSVSEIIKDEVTGFIVSDRVGVYSAIERIGLIAPKKCREHVEYNFSNEKMIKQYEAVYRDLIAQNPLT